MDWAKFKASLDDKLNIAKNMISTFDRVENIVGKGENAGIFSFFHNVSKWRLSQSRYKFGLCGKKVIHIMRAWIYPLPNNKINNIYRQQNKCGLKFENCLWDYTKDCEKMLVTNIFSFSPQCFQKTLKVRISWYRVKKISQNYGSITFPKIPRKHDLECPSICRKSKS